MADINVERKGPSIWPWIIGLLVLALLIWAIAEMVSTDRQETAAREEVEQPPAAVPAPAPTPAPGAEAPDISTVMPLGPEDENVRVTARGEVVGQPTREGFWIRTPQNEVIFARTNMPATTGQMVMAMGTVRRNDPQQAATWMQEANLQPAPGWKVVQDMHLEVMQMEAQEMQPGAPQQPGVQPPAAPGDTVRGRY